MKSRRLLKAPLFRVIIVVVTIGLILNLVLWSQIGTLLRVENFNKSNIDYPHFDQPNTNADAARRTGSWLKTPDGWTGPTVREIFDSAMKQYDNILRQSNRKSSSSWLLNDKNPPTCLKADSDRTAQTIAEIRMKTQNIPLPFLNVGMPKCGSSSLNNFFRCAGVIPSHYTCCYDPMSENKRHSYTGLCMKLAIENGLPPFTTCDGAEGVQAMTQMDFSDYGEHCFYPQITGLDHLHEEYPEATFFLLFRPINDWIQSVRRWEDLHDRMVACDLPGFPAGTGVTDEELAAWVCQHVLHIRAYAEAHPSHALIELDLYNDEDTAQHLATLTHADPSCWEWINSYGRRKSKLEHGTDGLLKLLLQILVLYDPFYGAFKDFQNSV